MKQEIHFWMFAAAALYVRSKYGQTALLKCSLGLFIASMSVSRLKSVQIYRKQSSMHAFSKKMEWQGDPVEEDIRQVPDQSYRKKRFAAPGLLHGQPPLGAVNL